MVAKCSECGAELRLRPATCPLCGEEVTPASGTVVELETYQSRVRELRDELERLRSEESQSLWA